jgi:hypothetical protein
MTGSSSSSSSSTATTITTLADWLTHSDGGHPFLVRGVGRVRHDGAAISQHPVVPPAGRWAGGRAGGAAQRTETPHAYWDAR